MTKPYRVDLVEPFFITEGVAAELTAARYKFEPPGGIAASQCRHDW